MDSTIVEPASSSNPIGDERALEAIMIGLLSRLRDLVVAILLCGYLLIFSCQSHFVMFFVMSIKLHFVFWIGSMARNNDVFHANRRNQLSVRGGRGARGGWALLTNQSRERKVESGWGPALGSFSKMLELNVTSQLRTIRVGSVSVALAAPSGWHREKRSMEDFENAPVVIHV